VGRPVSGIEAPIKIDRLFKIGEQCGRWVEPHILRATAGVRGRPCFKIVCLPLGYRSWQLLGWKWSEVILRETDADLFFAQFDQIALAELRLARDLNAIQNDAIATFCIAHDENGAAFFDLRVPSADTWCSAQTKLALARSADRTAVGDGHTFAGVRPGFDSQRNARAVIASAGRIAVITEEILR